jgi:hypothetical protein
MGGTVHGVVNKTWPRYGSSADENAMHLFAAIAQFFDHLCTVGGGSIMTRIASNYGGGSGFDYPGGSNPIGYNQVLGVWKMNTSTLRPGGGSALGEVYILLSACGTANDVWGLTASGTDTGWDGEVVISMAFREDGGNPWNGTSNNNGLDTPVVGNPWTDGGSTLHVFSRPNAPGGSYSSGKNFVSSLCRINNMYTMTITEGFFHGVADDDNWIFFYTGFDGMTTTEPKWYGAVCFGLGDLQPNCGSDPYNCYLWIDPAMPFSRNSDFGDPSGTSSNQGGAKCPRSQVHPVRFDAFADSALSQDRQPNNYSPASAVYDELALFTYTDTSWYGYAHEPGGSDFWRVLYGVPNESLDATNERAALGTQATLQDKLTIPWPSTVGEAPGATRTPAGVAF